MITEQLLKMLPGETIELPISDYDSLLSLKSRLKRNGKGEWQSKLNGKVLTVKRTR
jgi:hypothetical protein